MKNQDYNLIKLLHISLDNVWRIDKHYLKDAQKMKCRCRQLLKLIRDNEQKHVNLLFKEIKNHKIG